MSEPRNPCVFCGQTDDRYHLVPRPSLRERLAKKWLGVQPCYIVVCRGPRPFWPIWVASR